MSRYLAMLHCLSPLHNGAGEGMGAVDRPIIREVTTNYPYVQSSTLKGALRARATGLNLDDFGLGGGRARNDLIDLAFGSAAHQKLGGIGSLVFSDIQLFFFPVRSLAGTLAWTTTHLPLSRFHRSLGLTAAWPAAALALGAILPDSLNVASTRDEILACSRHPGGTDDVPGGDDWDASIRVPGGNLYGFERRAFGPRIQGRTRFAEFADMIADRIFESEPWRKFFRARASIVPDEAFSHFVNAATPVEPNIRILPTGVTKEGSLRYTEYLPAETLMFFMVWIDPPPNLLLNGGNEALAQLHRLLKRLLGTVDDPVVLQLGADESKGKGLVRIALLNPDASVETRPELSVTTGSPEGETSP